MTMHWQSHWHLILLHIWSAPSTIHLFEKQMLFVLWSTDIPLKKYSLHAQRTGTSQPVTNRRALLGLCEHLLRQGILGVQQCSTLVPLIEADDDHVLAMLDVYVRD